MTGPAWGYTACGRARVFDDGVLPPGWHPVPQREMTSDEATALAAAELHRDPAVEPRDAPDAGEPVPAADEIDAALDALEPRLAATPSAPESVRRRGRPPKAKPPQAA